MKRRLGAKYLHMQCKTTVLLYSAFNCVSLLARILQLMVMGHGPQRKSHAHKLRILTLNIWKQKISRL